MDSHETLSNLVTGSLSGIFCVLFAVYFAQNWILRPKFKLDFRDLTDNSGRLLLVNSVRHNFEAHEVYFLIIFDKETWDKRPVIQIKEGRTGWIPLVCDTQTKNIHKKPHVVLSMTIPQILHPNTYIPVLLFKKTEYPLEIYYIMRTKYGSFPKSDSPRKIEKGKLPKYNIY